MPLSLVALLALSAGQPKPPAPPASFPTLTTPATLGATRGKPVELTLTGTNLAGATAVWASGPFSFRIPDGQKDAAKLKVSVDVPKDTPVGVHAIRVATPAGVSNARPFVVDELPELAETDKNKARDTPQAVVPPCVVVGKAEPESSDFFRVPVKAGEPVTIEVLGRRLGSLIDPVVLLADGAGRELAGVYADDTPGLQSDARVVFAPKSNGDIIIEVRDTTYRGGADYGYRLRIGTFASVTAAFPLAVERGKATTVGFTGPGADAVPPVSVTAPADPGVASVFVAPKIGPVGGWPVPVRMSDTPELTEQEPNDAPPKANKLPVPGGVSARFATKGDVDCFAFPAKKGQKLVVKAAASELNLPTEVYLRVLDAKGAELAKSDPQQPGARVEFTPPADGEYVAACEHLNYQFGPNEAYHLSVLPAAPDFAVTLGLDRATAPVGGGGSLPVTGLTRTNGFAGPVELTFAGADGVTGTATLPAGANPSPTSPFFLPLGAKPGTKPGPFVGHVRATAKIDGKDAVRAADTGSGTEAAVAVVPPLPFTLEVTFDKPDVAKGGTVKGTVTAKRTDGFDGEIVLSVPYPPPGSTPKPKPIAKGANTVAFELPVGTAAPGPLAVLVRGAAKGATADAPPAVVAVGK